jgi:hypothetical protein
MTSDKINEVLRAQPSRSFTLQKGGGRRATPTRPEWAIINPARRTPAVLGPEGGTKTIDVLKVQSIEVLPGSKGRRRRAG